MRSLGNTPVDGEVQAVASGTLPSGQPVIVNADGTVSVAGLATLTQGVGSAVVFKAAQSLYSVAVYDPGNDKVIVGYADYSSSSGRGTAVVGTVSGQSISFGSPTVFTGNSPGALNAAFDVNAGSVIFSWESNANSGYGTAIVGTVSGTSISFGSSVVFSSSSSSTTAIAYDENAQKCVVVYRDQGSSGRRSKAKVATISGTSVSFGSEADISSNNAAVEDITYDASTQKVVAIWTNYSDGSAGCAAVGTISGTSISFGNQVTYESGTTSGAQKIVYDASAQKVLIAYKDGGDSNKGKCVVGTVSGTNISFGSIVVFDDSALVLRGISLAYDANASKTVISFEETGTSPNSGKNLPTTISGTTPSFGTATNFSNFDIQHLGSVYDPDQKKVVVVYGDEGGINSYKGTARVFQNATDATNLTSENYIGMSSGSVVQTGSAGSTGSEVVFDGNAKNFSGAYDTTNNKVLIAYRDIDNSSQGTAIVGTVSGSSISFGSPAIFETQSTLSFTSVSFDSTAGKLLISYRDGGNSNYGTAIVATISGTSVSFGTPTVFESANALYISSAYDASNNKTVIAYRDNDNSSYGTAVIGTINGTSVSFGTPVVFEAGATNWTNTVYDSSNNKIVIAYSDGDNGNYLTAIVGTVSGTSISFGSATAFAASSSYVAAAFDSTNNKIVIVYRDNGASSVGVALVGTVSGTSISFGSPVTFTGTDTYQSNSVSAVSFDTDSGGVLITYEGGDDRDATAIRGVVSGTSISFGTAVVLDTGGSHEFIGNVYDPDQNKNVVFYKDAGNSNSATAIVFQPNTIVTTRAEVASGSKATIDIGSAISTNQLSLTAGQQYFVQTDGTLGLTADDPSVIAGTAVSATDIIVKG